MAKITLELIPDLEHGGYTARIPDIPAYGEGLTEELAVSDLKQAVITYIETFGLDDALARVNVPTKLKQLSISLKDFCLA